MSSSDTSSGRFVSSSDTSSDRFVCYSDTSTYGSGRNRHTINEQKKKRENRPQLTCDQIADREVDLAAILGDVVLASDEEQIEMIELDFRHRADIAGSCESIRTGVAKIDAVTTTDHAKVVAHRNHVTLLIPMRLAEQVSGTEKGWGGDDFLGAAETERVWCCDFHQLISRQKFYSHVLYLLCLF